jgi:16S rRNA C1402 N4-methylase RsmH
MSEQTELGIEETDLQVLVRLSKHLKQLNDKIELELAKVKILQDEARELAEDQIPTMMKDLGLNSLQFDDSDLKIGKQVFAKIAEKNKKEAFAWLTKNKMDGMVSTQIGQGFARGMRDEAKKFVAVLDEAGVAYEVDEKIHPSTLKAFARDMIESGDEFPKELFGVFEKTIVTLK